MVETALIRLLRQRLSDRDLQAIRDLASEDDNSFEWDDNRILSLGRTLEEVVQRSKARVRDRYLNILDLPPGRQATILGNHTGAMLVEVARSLISQSFAARFTDKSRSLQSAQLALRIAEMLCELPYPSPEAATDLKAEALAYLANALRISSQISEAEASLEQATQLLDEGTNDRSLRADLLSLWASLRNAQGLPSEAAEFFDKEIQLRRILGDRRRLGTTLIDRGVIASWSESIEITLALLQEGCQLADDPRVMLLALLAIGERMARDEEGLQAWRIVCAAEVVLGVVDGGRLQHHLRWIKGITYRALGQLEDGAAELAAVRRAFLDEGIALQAALVGLDLASVRAAQGRTREVRELAEEAWTVFRSQRLERRALTAFLVFYRAARAERVDEALARRVADFLVRFQHDRRTRWEGDLEWRGERV